MIEEEMGHKTATLFLFSGGQRFPTVLVVHGHWRIEVDSSYEALLCFSFCLRVVFESHTALDLRRMI
jgi:hypothetical protein